MNPVLQLNFIETDVEARQRQDGRAYLYGSYDIPDGTTYCSYEYHVFSSGNFSDWTEHGVSLRTLGPNAGVPWSQSPLYAPDCICKNGVYYLYFCTGDGSEGVAFSKSPAGPFTGAVPLQASNGDGIDPAVFLDDDGQCYYYWGQFAVRGARLKPSMTEIDPKTFRRNLLTDREHGFHEGVSVRKRNGLYYMVYTDISRGKATCISYATGRSPLGPFQKGGVIIDNTGCDPKSWNNHGSIQEIDGRWYVFYHRSTHNSPYSRRVCAEPIRFEPDGSIPEVEMTTQGASRAIACTDYLEASRACLLSGKVHIDSVGVDRVYRDYLAFIEDGDWAAYKYLYFDGAASRFMVKAASSAYGGVIEIRLDERDGECIGRAVVEPTQGWQSWEAFYCGVKAVKGTHAVYLVFHGYAGRLFNVRGFQFLQES